MQCQIQQMKQSIANIQQSLRKLQCEETVRIHQNILPQSIIHENTYEKPRLSPKVTSSLPNVTRTEAYTPARHHLDDTQMKKVLRHNQGNKKHIMKKNKQKSETVKVKYIYDGPRVVYVPPIQTTPEYLIVTTDRSKHKKTKSYQQSFEVQYNPYHQYGGAQTQRNYITLNHLTKKKNKNKINGNSKKEQRLAESHRQMNRGRSSQKDINTKFSYTTVPINGNLPNQTDQKTHKRKQNSKKLKNMKVQCNIKQIKIKQQFVIDWDPNTDSEFSQMQI